MLKLPRSCPWESSGFAGNSIGFSLRDLIYEKLSIEADLSDLHAGGKGISPQTCILSSIGEFCERFLGSLIYFEVRDKLIYGSYEDLINRRFMCLNPSDFKLFDKRIQKNINPYTEFSPYSKLRWIKCRRFLSDEELWVPAQLILPFYILEKEEDLIGYATSGGLSFHYNKKEAVFRSILEIIERDALNVGWYCNIKPVEIDKSYVENILKGLFIPYNLRVVVEDVYVVVCISIEDSFEQYSFICGCGSDISLDKAVLKAYSEYAQAEKNIRFLVYYSSRFHSAYLKDHLSIEVSETVDSFFKAMIFYGLKSQRDKIKAHFSNCEIYKPDEPKNFLHGRNEKLVVLKNILENSCIDPLIIDLTPNYWKHFGYIIRAFSENLSPTMSPNAPLLGHKRLEGKKHTYPLPFP